MSKIIISDSSPLIALGSIDQLSVLFQLFEQVVIPKIVADECLVDKTRPGAFAISQAIDGAFIQIHPPFPANNNELFEVLDEGEAAAITLANSLCASLLIDEKLGRHVAKQLGVKIIGTIGILLLAKQKNLIPSVKPILTLLKNGHYFLSDQLIKEALMRAGEK